MTHDHFFANVKPAHFELRRNAVALPPWLRCRAHLEGDWGVFRLEPVGERDSGEAEARRRHGRRGRVAKQALKHRSGAHGQAVHRISRRYRSRTMRKGESVTIGDT
eukprot:1361283-Pleurochrysis_carterae.AAC.1